MGQILEDSKQLALDNRDVTTQDSNELLSILLCSHNKASLEIVLASIFSQASLYDFEVIACDDASADGAWDILCEYADDYPEKVTLCRNHQSLGKGMNRKKGLLMCKGSYVVELQEKETIDYDYVASVISLLKKDNFVEHNFIKKLKPGNYFIPAKFDPILRSNITDRISQPLVSVCIYNYNYGRYLRQCLQSVVEQTYSNIEICFSDNASTDESWEIALEYAARYPEKINLTRNRINFGPNVNLWNCELNMSGKYVLKLCSDDAIKNDFIETCVNALETNPEAGFVMVHRDILDEFSNVSSEPPFYEKSCVIPGGEQAAVYMMSSINPSISQIFYRFAYLEGKRMAGNLNDRWFGDRIMDFHICCERPIIYIKEPLLLNRVHDASEGSSLNGNLLQCIGEYVLLHQLSDIASMHSHMDKARERLPLAVEKLASLCLRYCIRILTTNDEYTAKRYFHLSLAISPDIEQDAVYQSISEYWSLDEKLKVEALQKWLEHSPAVVSRKVSYPAPEGSIAL